MAASTSLTPSQRRQRAQIAAHTSWANTEDRTARSQAGRDAMYRKFEDQVDPERKLAPAERAKRVESARKAHYTRLAFISAKARQARAHGGDAA